MPATEVSIPRQPTLARSRTAQTGGRSARRAEAGQDSLAEANRYLLCFPRARWERVCQLVVSTAEGGGIEEIEVAWA